MGLTGTRMMLSTLFLSVPAHDSTTSVELIARTKTLLTDVYAIGSNYGLNISKVLQEWFREHGILINIWSNNAQEKFMGSVWKLLCAYGVESNKSEAHNKNQNPDGLPHSINKRYNTHCSWPIWRIELVLAPLYEICHWYYQLHGAPLIVLTYPTLGCLRFFT